MVCHQLYFFTLPPAIPPTTTILHYRGYIIEVYFQIFFVVLVVIFVFVQFRWCFFASYLIIFNCLFVFILSGFFFHPSPALNLTMDNDLSQKIKINFPIKITYFIFCFFSWNITKYHQMHMPTSTVMVGVFFCYIHLDWIIHIGQIIDLNTPFLFTTDVNFSGTVHWLNE